MSSSRGRLLRRRLGGDRRGQVMQQHRGTRDSGGGLGPGRWGECCVLQRAHWDQLGISVKQPGPWVCCAVTLDIMGHTSGRKGQGMSDLWFMEREEASGRSHSSWGLFLETHTITLRVRGPRLPSSFCKEF